MSQCGTVGMDRYWNYVATPLFLIVISFGIFALFSAEDIQLIDRDDMDKAMNLLKKAQQQTTR